MKPLLYFFPKSEDLKLDDPSTLPEWVRPLAIECGNMRAGVSRGPNGSAGTVVWFPPSPEMELDPDCSIGFFPDKQTWIAGPGYWVGFFKDAMPSSEDLYRPEMIAGYFLPLGDGHRWVCPVGRYSDGELNFPKSIGWGPDGKMVEQILPKYQDLCQTAQNVYEYLSESDEIVDIKVPYNPDTIETSAECLMLNYAIEKIGITALGLLDSRCVPLIISALVDLPNTLEFLIKKKEQGLISSDSSDGVQDTNE